MATKIAQNLTGQNLTGQLLMDRYLVIEPLETGGFSQTYLAIDTEQPGSSCCVLKFLDRQLNPGLDFRSLHHLFEAEAHALGRLGRDLTTLRSSDRSMPDRSVPELMAYCRDRHQVYLVQEFIDGERLDAWMGQTQQPKLKQVIHILAEVLHVLHQIHGQGIIHCDIKPSNLIQRQEDKKIFLIDFGACLLRDLQLQTQYNLNLNFNQDFALGTLGYMPQEQAAGHPQFNSDLYALGMMVIQIMTGIAPQELERYPNSQEWNWHGHVPKPLLNLQLIPILDRMVRIDHQARYQSAAAVLEDLQDLIAQVALSKSSAFFRIKLPNNHPNPPIEKQDISGVPTIRKATRQSNSVNPTVTPTYPFLIANR